MPDKVVLEIRGEDKAGPIVRGFSRDFDKFTGSIARTGKEATTAWDGLTLSMSKSNSVIGRVAKGLFSLQGIVVGLVGAYGLKRLGESALDVASGFEQMEIKLNALTEGRGAETLKELNDWALEMPVNTRKAVDTFVMMKAMGLDPNIRSMETLVDVASIFGEEAMPRVARALGQMQSLGRLSAEELNQLSEAGINARKYLTEAFGMTVEELQKSQVSIEQIIGVIMKGLRDEFGGAAREAQKTWKGLTTTTKSYLEEIARSIMEAGVFDELKGQLEKINEQIKAWIDNNRELIKIKVPEYIEKVKNSLEKLWEIGSKIDTETLGYGIAGWIIGSPLIGILTGLTVEKLQEAESELKKLGKLHEGEKKTLLEWLGILKEIPPLFPQGGMAGGRPDALKWLIDYEKEYQKSLGGEKGAGEGGATAPTGLPAPSKETQKILDQARKDNIARLAEAIGMENQYIEDGLKKQQDMRQANLEALDAAMSAETEIINQALVEQYLAHQAHQERLVAMKSNAAAKFISSGQKLLIATDTQNKTLFKIFQSFSAAHAVISAHRAAAKALAEVPWPYNWIEAAAEYAAAMAQVVAIKSAAPGGGIAGGGAMPTYAASPTTGLPEIPSQQEQGPRIEIHVHGPVMGESKEELGDYLLDLINDATEVRGGKLKATEVLYD